MMREREKNEEHAYRRILREIKEDRLPKAILLFGDERYLVARAAAAVAEKYVPEGLRALDVARLDASETTAENVIAHCENLPVGPTKIIELDVSCILSTAPGGRASDEDALAAYAGKVPTGCILVLTADKPDKRKKLYKRVSEGKGAYDFTRLGKSDLEGFIKKRLKAANRRAGPAALAEFIRLTGYLDEASGCDLYEIENGVEKLIAYGAGEEIGRAEVAAVTPESVTLNVFAFSEAVSRGRRDRAFDLLARMTASGESAYKLLGLLFSQFEFLLSIREMADAGFSEREMAERLGAHAYRVKKTAEQARRLSVRALRDILGFVCDADRHIMTGLLRDELALEMFVSRAAEAQGGVRRA